MNANGSRTSRKKPRGAALGNRVSIKSKNTAAKAAKSDKSTATPVVETIAAETSAQRSMKLIKEKKDEKRKEKTASIAATVEALNVAKAAEKAAEKSAAVSTHLIALGEFYKDDGDYNNYFRDNVLIDVLADADSLHDFRHGYRGKKSSDKEGLAEANIFLNGKEGKIEKFLYSLPSRSTSTETIDKYREVLVNGKSKIEENIKAFFESKAEVPWISEMEPNARLTYDTILEEMGNDPGAYGQELQSFDAIELIKGSKGVSDLTDLQKISIGQVLIAFLFGDPGVECYFTCDSAPKQVRKLLENIETVRGLIVPQNIADSATSSLDKPLSLILSDIFMFPHAPSTPDFVSTANNSTRDQFSIVYRNDSGSGFSASDNYAWTYNITNKEDTALAIEPIRYGGGNGNEGPSVNQLLELQLTIREGIRSPATIGVSTSQLLLGPHISPITGFLRPEIRANTSSLLMDIKRAGDQDQCQACLLARYMLNRNVALITGDPTAGIRNRIYDNPTIEHYNDRIRIYRSTRTNAPLTPEQIATIQLKKLHRDINKSIRILHFVCNGLHMEIGTAIAKELAEKTNPFWEKQRDTLLAYLEPVRRIDTIICESLTVDPAIAYLFGAYTALQEAYMELQRRQREGENMSKEIRDIRKQNIADAGDIQIVESDTVEAIQVKIGTATALKEKLEAGIASIDINKIDILIDTYYTPVPFALTRQYPRLQLYPNYIVDLLKELISCYSYLSPPVIDLRTAPINIVAKIQSYNSRLSDFVNSLYTTPDDATAFYQKWAIFFVAEGTPCDRTTIPFNQTGDDGDKEEEDDEAVIIEEETPLKRFEDTFTEFTKTTNRVRKNELKEQIEGIRREIRSTMRLPADIPGVGENIPAIQCGGGGRNDTLAEILLSFFSQVKAEMNSRISKTVPVIQLIYELQEYKNLPESLFKQERGIYLAAALNGMDPADLSMPPLVEVMTAVASSIVDQDGISYMFNIYNNLFEKSIKPYYDETMNTDETKDIKTIEFLRNFLNRDYWMQRITKDKGGIPPTELEFATSNIAVLFSLAAFHDAITPTTDKVSYFYLLIPQLSSWNIDLPTRIYDIPRFLESLRIIFAVPTDDNIKKQLKTLKEMRGGGKRRTRRRTDATASRRRRTIRRRK